MRGTELYSSPRSITRTLAQLVDANAVKTAIATNVAAQSYSGAALNGALGPGPITCDPAVYVSVTTSAQAATYNTADSIVITGTRAGQTVTGTILLTKAAGGETLVCDQPFDSITQIDTPAMLGGAGQLEFGVSGIGCRAIYRDGSFIQLPYRRIRVGAVGGAVHIGYYADFEDTITYPADTPDEIQAERIFGDTTTADPVTVYW